jgi:hypothetical protein
VADLEADLQDVSRHLAIVEDPGLPARVSAALAAEPHGARPIRRHRRAILAAAAVAIVGTGWTAAPALAEWWRTRVGGIEIRRTPDRPPATSPPSADLGAALGLGRRTTLAELRAAGGLGLRKLSGRDPSQVWVGDVDGIRVVSLVYEPTATSPATVSGVGVLLQQFASPMAAPALMMKGAGPGTRVEDVSVRGARGVWLEGGHGIVLRADGDALFAPARLAANTLAWEVDGVTYRLESALDQEAALGLARSIR